MEKPESTSIVPEGMALIVAHDAGGAEILSSFLKLNNIPYFLCIAGPAVKIFQRKLGSVDNYNLEEGIERVNWVLTGTSWASDLEYRAIGMAKECGKFVSSFLDHWVNYRERFNWHGPETLPDEIWVGDDDAYDLALSLFNNTPIKRFPNPYWQEIKRIKKKKSHKYKFLFFSNNFDGISEISVKNEVNDFQILLKAFDLINEITSETSAVQLTIRLHPSESLDKYFGINIPVSYSYDPNSNIIDSLKTHSIAIGCDSMGLVLAKMAGLDVINIDIPGKTNRAIPLHLIN